MKIYHYFHKMRGTTNNILPRVNNTEIVWSWIGGFCGIACVAWLNHFFFTGSDLSLMSASFGASAVLVYGAIRSPLAQPRNLIGGHMISALIGVLCWKLFQPYPEFAQAIAVASAISAMHFTRTLHPPGGATALNAVIGSSAIHKLGFWYVIMPATLGPLILLAVAILINNIPKTRRYPEVWF